MECAALPVERSLFKNSVFSSCILSLERLPFPSRRPQKGSKDRTGNRGKEKMNNSELTITGRGGTPLKVSLMFCLLIKATHGLEQRSRLPQKRDSFRRAVPYAPAKDVNGEGLWELQYNIWGAMCLLPTTTAGARETAAGPHHLVARAAS